MKRIIIAFAATILASGCSLSPVIDSDIVEYNKAVSDSGNKLLLLNVLRARDRAPLLFSAVQLVHGSLQLSANTNFSVPFGNGKLKVANTWGGQIAASSSPTFDVSSLNTQDFTLGVLHPVEPPVVKYFLDRGDLDTKIILLLFFSELEVEKGAVVPIDAEHTATLQEKLEAVANGRFGAASFFANAYDELTPVGPPMKLAGGAMKDVASIDQTKYRLRAVEGRRSGEDLYQLYAVSAQKVAFCFRIERPGAESRFVALGSVFRSDLAALSNDDPRCTQSQVTVEPGEHEHGSGGFEKVTTRSVEGMIQFLGGVLRWEQEHGRPMTFDDFIRAPGAAEPNPGLFGTNTSDVFFSLAPGSSQEVYGVNYDGERYVVNPVSPPGVNCGRDHAPGLVCDHTLEVLALLSKLLDMNKSAKDLPITQSVQIVP